MDALRAAATDLAKTLSAVEGVASVSDGQEDSSTEAVSYTHLDVYKRQSSW